MNNAFKPAAHGHFNSDVTHCEADTNSYLLAKKYLGAVDAADEKANKPVLTITDLASRATIEVAVESMMMFEEI